MAAYSEALLRADAERFLRDELAKRAIPQRLIAEAIMLWQERIPEHGRTLGSVLATLIVSCQTRMTAEERLESDIASMSDREMLVAVYRMLRGKP